MISVQISLQDPVFIVFRYIPRNGIAGSQSSSSIFDFLRNLCTFFHSKCIFYSPTNRASIILISLHLHQHSLFCLLFFLTATILMGVRGYLTVVLTYISLTMCMHTEHSFKCLLAICISSLEKCLLKSSIFFFIIEYIILSLHCRSSLYILDINPLSNIWFANIFFHLVGCLFTAVSFAATFEY